MFLLENVTLELGFALGLFAVFGIIRYRTETISVKEMTYLFIVIGLSVMNALANKKISYFELLFANISIIFLLDYFERNWMLQRSTKSKYVLYEKIDMIAPEKRDELVDDIQNRTGLRIEKLEIEQIDLVRDTAKIKFISLNKFLLFIFFSLFNFVFHSKLKRVWSKMEYGFKLNKKSSLSLESGARYSLNPYIFTNNF